MSLKTITLRGYKSFANLDQFGLRNLNVLIGANGAGKSNFISAFRFLASVTGDNFQVDVQKSGGPDAFLRGGRKKTHAIEMEVHFNETHGIANGYCISLEPTQDNRLIFTREESWIFGPTGNRPFSFGRGHEAAKVVHDEGEVSNYVSKKLRTWRQYHFHDTSDTAAVKGLHPANDTLRLKPDAANLAAYLRRLCQDPLFASSYKRIVETIQLAAPFFGDFVFRESENVELEWTERGVPDTPWKAHVLSDGTLRFMCLATLLLQPTQLMPDTILIDEPELGLHPYAINLLASMIKRASESQQIIVSTQSVELLNAFDPEDVVVVEREDGASVLKRLERDTLIDWLDDEYAPTLGELWKRNILGGRPAL